MDFEDIGRISANTTLAACAAGLTAMFTACLISRKWDMNFTVNGFLAGLVAITCPCYGVSPAARSSSGASPISSSAIILGGGVELLECCEVQFHHDVYNQLLWGQF
ncbi:MAG TPA: hypothetical protein VHY48_14190 [Acidobacteriaceae bacterium]|jgi:Amt family ammonium transporter|nr:hypothetical protein [Acidobacteriaceae bacterium]